MRMTDQPLLDTGFIPQMFRNAGMTWAWCFRPSSIATNNWRFLCAADDQVDISTSGFQRVAGDDGA